MLFLFLTLQHSPVSCAGSVSNVNLSRKFGWQTTFTDRNQPRQGARNSTGKGEGGTQASVSSLDPGVLYFLVLSFVPGSSERSGGSLFSLLKVTALSKPNRLGVHKKNHLYKCLHLILIREVETTPPGGTPSPHLFVCLLFQIRKLRLKAIQIIQGTQGAIPSELESWDSTSGILIPLLELLPYTSEVPGYILGLCFIYLVLYPWGLVPCLASSVDLFNVCWMKRQIYCLKLPPVRRKISLESCEGVLMPHEAQGSRVRSIEGSTVAAFGNALFSLLGRSRSVRDWRTLLRVKNSLKEGIVFSSVGVLLFVSCSVPTFCFIVSDIAEDNGSLSGLHRAIGGRVSPNPAAPLSLCCRPSIL